MRKQVNTFKAMSDANRLRILLMLRVRPLCVCELHEVLNIALSTISAHLKLLRSTGLVEDAKEGRWVVYRLVKDNSFFNRILNALDEQLRNDETCIRDKAVISRIDRTICARKLKAKKKSASHS